MWKALHHDTVGSPTPVPTQEKSLSSYNSHTRSVQVSQELYTHFGIYHINPPTYGPAMDMIISGWNKTGTWYDPVLRTFERD